MALTAVSVSDVIEHEDEEDPAKGTPEATRFMLGLLDIFISAHVYDQQFTIGQDEGQSVTRMKLNATNVEVVRFGLRGWSNFRDGVGNDVPFTTVKRNVHGREYVVASDETLQRLGIRLIQRLAARIKELNNVSRAEAKNSVTA